MWNKLPPVVGHANLAGHANGAAKLHAKRRHVLLIAYPTGASQQGALEPADGEVGGGQHFARLIADRAAGNAACGVFLRDAVEAREIACALSRGHGRSRWQGTSPQACRRCRWSCRICATSDHRGRQNRVAGCATGLHRRASRRPTRRGRSCSARH